VLCVIVARSTAGQFLASNQLDVLPAARGIKSCTGSVGGSGAIHVVIEALAPTAPLRVTRLPNSFACFESAVQRRNEKRVAKQGLKVAQAAKVIALHSFDDEEALMWLDNHLDGRVEMNL